MVCQGCLFCLRLEKLNAHISGRRWDSLVSPLKSKMAIVTGAGAGIGFAVAQVYAEMGANVIIWYNTNKSAHSRAAEIQKNYGVECRSSSQFQTI